MGLGIALRTSRPATWTECRQRGGAMALGYVAMLDLAGSDALTSDIDATTGKTSPGTPTVASSPLATVIPATAELAHGRVGIVMGTATRDDGLGTYEFGETSDGGIVPVLVTNAVVKVDATSVAGAALQIQTGATFCADGAGGAFAILLEDCSADDGKGPSASLNYRQVILFSDGLPTGADLTSAGIADGAITNAKLRDSAALSVIGRSANSVGDAADIVGADGQVLRVSGTTLGFGTIVAAGIASDAVTTAKILDGNVTAAKIAALTFNAQTGTDYTLAASDRGLVVTLTNAGAIALEVPLNATVAIPVGFECVIVQGGAGLVSVTPEVGVTINSLAAATDLAGQYAAATLIKTATDTWMLIGGIA